MIIVKLTILLLLITAFYMFAIKLWVGSNPIKASLVNIGGKYPKWIDGVGWLILLDAIGIFASVVWVLFFR